MSAHVTWVFTVVFQTEKTETVETGQGISHIHIIDSNLSFKSIHKCMTLLYTVFSTKILKNTKTNC